MRLDASSLVSVASANFSKSPRTGVDTRPSFAFVRVRAKDRLNMAAVHQAYVDWKYENGTNLISKSNQLMRAWENGREEEYKSLCVPNIHAQIPQYGVDMSSLDAWWQVRAGMGSEPLAVHVLDTHVVKDNTVTGITRTYSRTDGHMQVSLPTSVCSPVV